MKQPHTANQKSTKGGISRLIYTTTRSFFDTEIKKSTEATSPPGVDRLAVHHHCCHGQIVRHLKHGSQEHLRAISNRDAKASETTPPFAPGTVRERKRRAPKRLPQTDIVRSGFPPHLLEDRPQTSCARVLGHSYHGHLLQRLV